MGFIVSVAKMSSPNALILTEGALPPETCKRVKTEYAVFDRKKF
jgi:hypothetical protein